MTNDYVVVQGTPDRSEVLVAWVGLVDKRKTGTAWLVDLEGKRLSSNLPVPVDATTDTTLIHPTQSLVVVASNNDRKVRTVDLVARTTIAEHAIPDYTFHRAFGPADQLIIHMTNYRFCQFGQNRIPFLDTLRNIWSFAYSRIDGSLLIERRPTKKGLESSMFIYRNGKASEEIYRSHSGVSFVAFGKDWIALTEAGKITVIDRAGKVLWRFESPEPDVEFGAEKRRFAAFTFNQIATAPDLKRIIAPRRGFGGGTTMMEFDAESGRLLRSAVTPQDSIPVPIDNGRYWIDMNCGVFDIDTFAWSSRDWMKSFETEKRLGSNFA